MAAEAVGVGIIGTGLSATQHMTALVQVPLARVVAVVGTSEDKARVFAEKWGIPRAYGSAAAMLGDPDVEAVHLCTPPDTRVALAEAAAGAGKHVMIEKPMARNVAEADRVIAACDAAGVALGAMFQNRFTPLPRRVKEALDVGRFGRLLLVTLSSKWFRSAEYYRGSSWRGTAAREGGAALINQSIHAIDLLRWICGPVSEVQAITATQLHPIEMEDVGVALLRFESGAVGSLVGTTVAYPGFAERLELHGSEGSVVLVQGDGRLEWYLRGQEPIVEQADTQVSGARSDPAATTSHGHVAQFTDFYAAIRERRRPFVDGREGRHALELVEAIYRSGRSHLPVRLPL